MKARQTYSAIHFIVILCVTPPGREPEQHRELGREAHWNCLRDFLAAVINRGQRISSLQLVPVDLTGCP